MRHGPPTGKSRFRLGFDGSFFNKKRAMVLQVECEVIADHDHNGMPDTFQTTLWRDAKVEDLTLIHGAPK